MLLSLLDTKNPAYDREATLNLRALYKGGKLFRSRIGNFLLRRPVEPDEMWETRKKEAHYRNYIAPIINQFCAILFSSKPVVRLKEKDGQGLVAKRDMGPDDEFYSDWREDCDGNGTDLEAFFKERLVDAMVEKTGYFLLEHAQPDEGEAVPEDKKGFRDAGLDAVRLRKVDSTEVYDWERDETGKLIWALVHSAETPRKTLGQSRDTVVETFQFYTDETVTTYRFSWSRAKGRPNNAKYDVPQIGQPLPHRFGKVPLIELELQEDLWVGNLLESPQTAHFRVANAETWAISKICYAMPVLHVLDDMKLPTMGNGYGLVMGVEESVDWMSPPTVPFDATNTTAATLKDEIFRIAQQMAMGVDNNAAAVGRSGDSKLADAGFMRVVLLAYSRKVKEVIERVYDLVSVQRGDEYKWSVEGFEDFDAADLAALMELMTELLVAGGITSKTFKLELQTRVAEAAMPDLDEAKKAQIKQELADGIDDEEAMSAELRKASIDSLKDGSADPNALRKKKAAAAQLGNSGANRTAARGRTPTTSAG